MNTKNIIYNDYDKLEGESFLNVDQALDLLQSLNWHKGTFLYFEINETETFQLIYEGGELYLVEIANDSDDMVYLQKFATYEEAVELIEYYFENEEIGSTIGFYEVPINTKTLDDILEENK